MKKLIAMLITFTLALGCAAACGEGTVSTVSSMDGAFSISSSFPRAPGCFPASGMKPATFIRLI